MLLCACLLNIFMHFIYIMYLKNYLYKCIINCHYSILSSTKLKLEDNRCPLLVTTRVTHCLVLLWGQKIGYSMELCLRHVPLKHPLSNHWATCAMCTSSLPSFTSCLFYFLPSACFSARGLSVYFWVFCHSFSLSLCSCVSPCLWLVLLLHPPSSSVWVESHVKFSTRRADRTDPVT